MKVDILIVKHYNKEDKDCNDECFAIDVRVKEKCIARYDNDYCFERVEGFIDGLRSMKIESIITYKNVSDVDNNYNYPILDLQPKTDIIDSRKKEPLGPNPERKEQIQAKLKKLNL